MGRTVTQFVFVVCCITYDDVTLFIMIYCIHKNRRNHYGKYFFCLSKHCMLYEVDLNGREYVMIYVFMIHFYFILYETQLVLPYMMKQLH